MGIAFAALAIGGWFVYSALKGVSLANVFSGDGSPLDPGGSLSSPSSSSAPSADTENRNPDITDLTSQLPGTTIVDGKPVVNWIAVQVLGARKHGWTGHVTSGVRTRTEQMQACIGVCGNANGCPGRCAKPGTSNHEVKNTVYPYGAVDLTDGAAFDAALKRAKAAGDAGKYPRVRNALPNDPVHRSFTGR